LRAQALARQSPQNLELKMKDEVEDFLRRVAQMRAQAEAQAKGQQQRLVPPKPPAKPPRPPQPVRLTPTPQVDAYAPLVEAEVVTAELADMADRVSRQVTEDLRGTEQIAEHTRHLGEEVDAADDKLEAHLHQVFDHQLGRLKKSTLEAGAQAYKEPSPEFSLGQIMRLLRSSDSIRDAIVMSEILRRPDEPW
jgi:hypothetical protein